VWTMLAASTCEAHRPAQVSFTRDG
jgi:hypothetical protein